MVMNIKDIIVGFLIQEKKLEKSIKNINIATVVLERPVHETILYCIKSPKKEPKPAIIHSTKAYHKFNLPKIITIHVLLIAPNIVINIPVPLATIG